jgi:hypothetical protein
MPWKKGTVQIGGFSISDVAGNGNPDFCLYNLTKILINNKEHFYSRKPDPGHNSYRRSLVELIVKDAVVAF